MGLKHSILAGLFSTISLFCLGQGLTEVDSILSGDIYRRYRVYRPASYNGSQAVPVVLNLHGYSSNALQQQLYSNFMPIADTANFLVVHPEGTNLLGGPFWNAGIAPSPNDVQFLSSLIDTLQQQYNVNYRRVYSCGMSNGGIMSYYLACYLYQRIAAVASVTGSMFNAWLGACSPPRPVPVMEIHGTADAVVPYAGDTNFAPIDSVVKKWALHNGCTPVPQVSVVPNSVAADNSTATRYVYANGIGGSSVELYKITGGSHSWPGAVAIFPNTNQDVNASAEIWRFFRQYELGQFIGDVGVKEEAGAVDVNMFPNPVSDRLMIENAAGCQLTLMAPDGRVLLVEQPNKGWVSVSGLPEGIYFLQLKDQARQFTFRFVKN